MPLFSAPFFRVVVVGDSMRPALEPGDRLLVHRRARVAPGDVVAVADPRQPGRVLVKRVAAVTPEGVHVRGDNAAATTDSRVFGAVSPAAVQGRAVYRYAPVSRRGGLLRRGGGTLGDDVGRRRRAGDGRGVPG